MQEAQLEVRFKGHVVLLERELVVGRAATCDVVVDEATVSRIHLRVQSSDRGFLITDESSSGVFEADGQPLRRKTLVADGTYSVWLASPSGQRVDFRVVSSPANKDEQEPSDDRASEPAVAIVSSAPSGDSLGFNFRQFGVDFLSGLRPVWRTLVFAVVGAGIAFCLNVWIISRTYDGLRKVPDGTAATVGASEGSARVMWFLAMMLLTSLLTMLIVRGPRAAWKSFVSMPTGFVALFRSGAELAFVACLASTAIVLVLVGTVLPSLSLVLGLGALALLPSAAGIALTSVVGRVFASAFNQVKSTALGDTRGAGAAALVGAAIAMVLRWWIDDRRTQLILAAVAIALVIASLARGRRPTLGATVLVVSTVIAAKFGLDTTWALADDGGWTECGANWGDFFGCEGTGDAANESADAAAAGGAGGAAGSSLGNSPGRDEPDAAEPVVTVDEEGRVISRTEDTDGDGKLDKTTKYDPETGNRIEERVDEDGDGDADRVTKFDPETDQPTEERRRNDDGGSTKNEDTDRDGEWDKTTKYDQDDRRTEERVDEDGDGDADRVTKFDPETDQPTEERRRNDDGGSTKNEDTDRDGEWDKTTKYDQDDRRTEERVDEDGDGDADRVTKFDPETDQPTEERRRNDDGGSTKNEDTDRDGEWDKTTKYDQDDRRTEERVDEDGDGDADRVTKFDPETDQQDQPDKPRIATEDDFDQQDQPDKPRIATEDDFDQQDQPDKPRIATEDDFDQQDQPDKPSDGPTETTGLPADASTDLPRDENGFDVTQTPDGDGNIVETHTDPESGKTRQTIVRKPDGTTETTNHNPRGEQESTTTRNPNGDIDRVEHHGETDPATGKQGPTKVQTANPDSGEITAPPGPRDENGFDVTQTPDGDGNIVETHTDPESGKTRQTIVRKPDGTTETTNHNPRGEQESTTTRNPNGDIDRVEHHGETDPATGKQGPTKVQTANPDSGEITAPPGPRDENGFDVTQTPDGDGNIVETHTDPESGKTRQTIVRKPDGTTETTNHNPRGEQESTTTRNPNGDIDRVEHHGETDPATGKQGPTKVQTANPDSGEITAPPGPRDENGFDVTQTPDGDGNIVETHTDPESGKTRQTIVRKPDGTTETTNHNPRGEQESTTTRNPNGDIDRVEHHGETDPATGKQGPTKVQTANPDSGEITAPPGPRDENGFDVTQTPDGDGNIVETHTDPESGKTRQTIVRKPDGTTETTNHNPRGEQESTTTRNPNGDIDRVEHHGETDPATGKQGPTKVQTANPDDQDNTPDNTPDGPRLAKPEDLDDKDNTPDGPRLAKPEDLDDQDNTPDGPRLAKPEDLDDQDNTPDGPRLAKPEDLDDQDNTPDGPRLAKPEDLDDQDNTPDGPRLAKPEDLDDQDNTPDKVSRPDTDNDGLPDSIDPDDDNDLIPDIIDQPDLDNDGIPDSIDPDTDNDGLPDSIDPDDDNDLIPDIIDQPDLDNDGIPDSIDPDTDNDGLPDSIDPDDDNDLIPDIIDQPDLDNDGIPDSIDPDTDNDGLPDSIDPDDDNDLIPDIIDQPDLDNDGIPDSIDPDTDNDGLPDSIDPDDDNDLIPDAGWYADTKRPGQLRWWDGVQWTDHVTKEK